MTLITINSLNVPGEYHGPLTGPFIARLEAKEDFSASDGSYIAKGSGYKGFGQDFPCSLNNTTKIFTIATGDAYATTDSSRPNTAYKRLAIYDTTTGKLVKALYTRKGIRVRHTINPTTWEDLRVYTEGPNTDAVSGFYTSAQTDALLDEKQDVLISGTNIKTVGGQSLMGTGDVPVVQEWGDVTGTLSDQADLQAALNTKASSSDLNAGLLLKQDVLESGVNIKQINGQDLPGSGNLLVTGGAAVGVPAGFVLRNFTYDKTLDKDAATLGELFDVLATALADSDNSLMPGPPVIGAPVVDSQSRITSHWAIPAFGAAPTGYVAQVATNAAFTTGVQTAVLGNITSHQFKFLSPVTLYYFRVAAIDVRGNQGAWSANSTATTSAALPGPNTIASIWGFREVYSYAGLEDGDVLPVAWADGSGHGRVATIAGTPTYVADDGDGIAAIINGAGFGMPDMSALTAGEIFLVLKGDAVGEPAPIKMGTSGSQDIYGSLGIVYSDFGSTVRHTAPIAGTGFDSWGILNIWSAPNDWGVNLNGVSLGSINVNTVSFSAAPTIGIFNFGNVFAGKYRASYEFSAKLSTADRNKMMAYIREQYYM